MNQVVTPPASTGAVQKGVALISGRIVAKRAISTQAGRQYLTVIKLPAPDQFTSPATIEVRSAQPLGEHGEDVHFKVRVGGYGRSYSKTDEDGVVTRVATADNHLTVVE